MNKENFNLLLAIVGDHARLLRSSGQTVSAMLIEDQARRIQSDTAEKPAEKKAKC